MSGRRVELLRGSVFLWNPLTGGTGFGPTRDINGIRRVGDYHKRSLCLRIYSDKTCAHYVDTNRETVASKAPGQSHVAVRRKTHLSCVQLARGLSSHRPPRLYRLPLPPLNTHTHTVGRSRETAVHVVYIRRVIMCLPFRDGGAKFATFPSVRWQ